MTITLPYIMTDGSVIDYNRPLADPIPVGKGIAPPVTTYAAFPLDTLDSDCDWLLDDEGTSVKDRHGKRICLTNAYEHNTHLRLSVYVRPVEAAQHKCEYYLRFGFEKDGLHYATAVPAPELVQPADDSPEYGFGGVFTPYADGGMYLTDPTAATDPYLGFSDEEMDTVVWVEGQQFGIEVAPEVSILSEMLPNFSISHVDGLPVADCVANVLDTKTGRLRMCAGIISYREFAMQSRSERENMEAFMLLLADHRNQYHDFVTHEDMCVHGERNYVASISRATGQPFAAKFCKRGQSRMACNPVWVNVDSTRSIADEFFGTTQAEHDRLAARVKAAELWGSDLAPGTLDVLARL